MRNSLRDMSCSATFFESDHRRDDNHSETFLSMRHSGHRTGETPDAPDLFLELTDRDPRGTATAPDMQKLRDQSWARRDHHRFYSDSSHSVTEREKLPHVVQQQLRAQMEMTKRRLKIFSASRDGQSTNAGVKKMGDRLDTDDQAGMLDRDEVITAIRQQGQQSDAIALGWEQTGESRVEVARLGRARGAQRDSDGRVTQGEVTATQRVVDGVTQTVKTGAANLMRIIMDRITEGRRNDFAVDQETWESLSPEIAKSQFRADPRSRTATAGITTEAEREAFATVERFIGQLNRQSGMQGQDIETQLQIVQFMDNAVTASHTSGEARFHAENILMEHVQGLSQEQATKRADGRADPLALRNVADTRTFSRDAVIARLASAIRDKVGSKSYMGEAYKTASRETEQKRIRSQAEDDISRAKKYDGTQAHQTFATADRHVRGLGTKFTRDRMDTTRTLDAISEAN